MTKFVFLENSLLYDLNYFESSIVIDDLLYTRMYKLKMGRKIFIALQYMRIKNLVRVNSISKFLILFLIKIR